MAKRIFDILVLLVAFASCAWTQNPWDDTERAACEVYRKGIKAPYYYCDCHMTSTSFTFPLDTIVKDTMWFDATINDIKQGLSAYWFADCAATIEVYLMCTNKTPIYKMTVQPNRMCEIDAAEIQKKIEENSDKVQEAISTLTPHMRVYPEGKGSGRVYCYPYDKGPASTCVDPLPLRAGMLYINADEEASYRLDYSQIPASSKAFIHWKEKKNTPCEMWLTMDSCTGEEIGRTKLSDSLHVYILDSAKLNIAREGQRPIWLHTKHAANKTGRIHYYIDPHFSDPAEAVSKSACQGKAIKQNGRNYTSDTAFVDTVWVKGDTLRTMELNLTFTAPEIEYDTLRLEEKDLKLGYRHTDYGVTLYAYGDTLIEVQGASACARKVLLTVMEPTAYEIVIDGQVKMRKQMQDGQVFIIIDDKQYNVFGQQTK